jgi:biotin carboxylase
MVPEKLQEPRLAVFYEQSSASILDVFESARGVCQLIWVIGWSTDTPATRVLARFGEVVDLTGMDETRAVECVSAAKPDGVIVFDDSPLRLAAAVGETLGLRFHSRDTAHLFTDKFAQRAALARAGVPVPKFWPVSASSDVTAVRQLISNLSFPVVLKPQTGSGSRNTFQVDDVDTLTRSLEKALERDEDMLIEEVLRERHPRQAQRFSDVLMVDSLVVAGSIEHIVVAGHFIQAPPFRGTGSFVPSHLSNAENMAVFEATEAAIKALGITDGFTNTDIILTPEGPRVLEVNGRIGGQIPTLLGLAGSSPLMPEAMRFAVGRSRGDIDRLRSGCVAFCAMYQAPIEATRLVELSGLDVVAKLPGVTRIVPNRARGDVIDWRLGTMSRLFTVYGVAKDHDHLYHLYDQIQRSTIARYETDESSLNGPSGEGKSGIGVAL